jgi:hypothetical protein
MNGSPKMRDESNETRNETKGKGTSYREKGRNFSVDSGLQGKIYRGQTKACQVLYGADTGLGHASRIVG